MDKSDLSDITSKSPKKAYKFRNSTKKKSKIANKKYKQHLESDNDDSDSDYIPDDDVILMEEEEEEEEIEEDDSSEEEEQ